MPRICENTPAKHQIQLDIIGQCMQLIDRYPTDKFIGCTLPGGTASFELMCKSTMRYAHPGTEVSFTCYENNAKVFKEAQANFGALPFIELCYGNVHNIDISRPFTFGWWDWCNYPDRGRVLLPLVACCGDTPGLTYITFRRNRFGTSNAVLHRNLGVEGKCVRQCVLNCIAQNMGNLNVYGHKVLDITYMSRENGSPMWTVGFQIANKPYPCVVEKIEEVRQKTRSKG